MASRSLTSSAGLVSTSPLTTTRPASIHSSASRREHKPARAITLAMRSCCTLAGFGVSGSKFFCGRVARFDASRMESRPRPSRPNVLPPVLCPSSRRERKPPPSSRRFSRGASPASHGFKSPVSRPSAKSRRGGRLPKSFFGPNARPSPVKRRSPRSSLRRLSARGPRPSPRFSKRSPPLSPRVSNHSLRPSPPSAERRGRPLKPSRSCAGPLPNPLPGPLPRGLNPPSPREDRPSERGPPRPVPPVLRPWPPSLLLRVMLGLLSVSRVEGEGSAGQAW